MKLILFLNFLTCILVHTFAKIAPIPSDYSPLISFFNNFTSFYLKSKRIVTLVEENGIQFSKVEDFYYVDVNYAFLYKVMDSERFLESNTSWRDLNSYPESEAFISSGDLKFLETLITSLHLRNPKAPLIYFLTSSPTNNEVQLVLQLVWQKFKMMKIVCFKIDKNGKYLSNYFLTINL